MAPPRKQTRAKGDGGTLENHSRKFMAEREDPGENGTEKIIKEICSIRKDMKGESRINKKRNRNDERAAG